MHTTPVLSDAERAVYEAHLQTDHDYRVYAEVLDLEEHAVAEADILDGQVNIDDTASPPRTGSVVISDPEGAISFGTSFAEDPTGTVWVARLLRLNHQVDVPNLRGDGQTVTVTAPVIVGVPTTSGRNGAEVTVEMGDKSLLADHGVRPHNYKKGMRVDLAIISILKDLTGERHYRIPTTRTTLKKSYAVGIGENLLTPWQAVKTIAGTEMGWRTYYSNDGYATCEPTRTVRKTAHAPWLLALPDLTADFTGFVNYVKVTSTRKIANTKKVGKGKQAHRVTVSNTTFTYESTAVLPPSHILSEQSLQRHGVPGTRPMVVSDNSLTSTKQTAARAADELRAGSDLDQEQSYEIIPFFHLDAQDRIDLPLGVGTFVLHACSIPLGVGGNMTLGAVKWVSKATNTRRVKSKATKHTVKVKGGKKH